MTTQPELLQFDSAGSGRAIVFLHGFPFTRAQWLDHLPVFSRFGRVIIPDLPGFGASPRQAEPSVPEMARSLFELLNALDVRGQVVLAGSSLGGYVALEFYRQFANRVFALCLFATQVEADSQEKLEMRKKTEAQLRREGLENLVSVFSMRLLAQRHVQPGSPIRERVESLIRLNAHAAEGLADAMRAMAQRKDSTGLLPEVVAPTLFVGGLEDNLMPIKRLEAMAAMMSQARVVELSECGHGVNLEQPHAFEAACSAFFREIGL